MDTKRTHLLHAVGRAVRLASAIVLIVMSVVMMMHFETKDASSDPYIFSGLFSQRPVVVVSGSMLPTIQINSISILEYCDIEDLRIGDIVMYQEPGTGMNITHRVIKKSENDSGNTFIRAKGDNNEIEDGIDITGDMVVGRLIKTYNEIAPYMGLFIQNGEINPKTAVVVLIMLAIVITFLMSIIDWIWTCISAFFSVMFSRKQTKKLFTEYDYAIDVQDATADYVEELLDSRRSKGIKNRLAAVYLASKIKAFNEATDDLIIALKTVRKTTGKDWNVVEESISSDTNSKPSDITEE